ncbi:hypothetical protein Trydic_g12528 [Trypoxylus dichotomus]
MAKRRTQAEHRNNRNNDVHKTILTQEQSKYMHRSGRSLRQFELKPFCSSHFTLSLLPLRSLNAAFMPKNARSGRTKRNKAEEYARKYTYIGWLSGDFTLFAGKRDR